MEYDLKNPLWIISNFVNWNNLTNLVISRWKDRYRRIWTFANKVVQMCTAILPMTTMMPTNFCCCRLVCAGGTLFGHMVIPSLYLLFFPSLSHALALLPFDRSCSPALPETLYLLFFYFSFFWPMPSLFRAIHGVTDPVEARNPFSSFWHVYFLASADEPFFLRSVIIPWIDRSTHGIIGITIRKCDRLGETFRNFICDLFI